MSEVIRAYYDDSYQKELRASITAVDGEWIELDRTIFYPLGGGQPGDTGVVIGPDGRAHRVLDTRKGESINHIKHQLDSALNIGRPDILVRKVA